MKKEFGVAVKGLIKNKLNEYLLLSKTVEESRLDKDSDLTDLPGGRLEYGEQIEDAIIREVFEETGIKIGLNNIIKPLNSVSVIRKDGLHLVIISYLIEVEDVGIVLSQEHDSYQWISREHKVPIWIKDIIDKDINFAVRTEIYTDIKEILYRICEGDFDENNLNLDSLQLMSLVIELENRFDIEIDDSDFTSNDFDSISGIKKVIESKL